ncbi:hypothetical protein llap_4317 [Limosa lapponica baueri]|uniref:Uncharacterized protein n=1 Tax=Limosa lapponica baueri TaxID=1758121 RepID=A0A2I0UH48_LIMLA|nr:hypothetical protein llap_4317 [Limosa lapponica baueri]
MNLEEVSHDLVVDICYVLEINEGIIPSLYKAYIFTDFSEVAALNPFSTQPVFVFGIALIHAQDLALGLIEFHEIYTGLCLKPLQDPLDGIPSLQCVENTTELGVIGKLAESALNPTVRVINKDVKQHQSEY